MCQYLSRSLISFQILSKPSGPIGTAQLGSIDYKVFQNQNLLRASEAFLSLIFFKDILTFKDLSRLLTTFPYFQDLSIPFQYQKLSINFNTFQDLWVAFQNILQGVT